MRWVVKTRINHIINGVLTVVFTIAFSGTALSAGAVCESSGSENAGYEMVKGVLAVKEGHGEFLVRTPDGNAQRFNIGLGSGSVKITRNGTPVHFSQLRVSDRIEVKYAVSDCKVIEIHASGS